MYMLVKFQNRDPISLGLLRDDFWSSFYPTLNALNSMFDALDEPVSFKGISGDSIPKMNIYAKKEGEKLKYVIEASVAGIKKEDIEVTLKGNTITIAHNPIKEKSEERVYMVREIAERSFRRNVFLPEMVDLDSLQTKYENGMICIEFEFFEKDPKAKVIKF